MKTRHCQQTVTKRVETKTRSTPFKKRHVLFIYANKHQAAFSLLKQSLTVCTAQDNGTNIPLYLWPSHRYLLTPLDGLLRRKLNSRKSTCKLIVRENVASTHTNVQLKTHKMNLLLYSYQRTSNLFTNHIYILFTQCCCLLVKGNLDSQQ